MAACQMCGGSGRLQPHESSTPHDGFCPVCGFCGGTGQISEQWRDEELQRLIAELKTVKAENAKLLARLANANLELAVRYELSEE